MLGGNSILSKSTMRRHHRMESCNAISNLEFMCLFDVGAHRVYNSSNIISTVERLVYRGEVVPIYLKSVDKF